MSGRYYFSLAGKNLRRQYSTHRMTSFAESWCFPSELKQQLEAASYDIRQLPEKFRSGRPKFEALFFDKANVLISRRIAMELMSKKTGKPYHMVSRSPK